MGNQTSTIAVTHAPNLSIGQDHLKPSIAGFDRLWQFVGLPGAVVFASGLLLTVLCALWAVAEGAAVPMVLMGGYCTLVATVILVAAVRVLGSSEGKLAPIAAAPQKPNYAAWKLVSKLNVANASRLWCGVVPGHPYSQESMAWASAMMDAIKTGALPIVGRPNASKEAIDRERANPTWHTEVTREALKAWATSHGHGPEFLRD